MKSHVELVLILHFCPIVKHRHEVVFAIEYLVLRFEEVWFDQEDREGFQVISLYYSARNKT